MWIAKIEFDGSDCALGSLCKKTEITLKGYPLKYKIENKELVVTIIGTIIGEQKNINSFLEIIRTAKQVKKFENSGNLIVCKYVEKKELKKIYEAELISLEPHTINKNGKEIMIIASFEKKEIMNVYEKFNKLYDAKLKYIKQEPINHISFLSKSPKITTIQNDSILFALNQGYYEFPRKISLQELAKRKKLSFSTFQAHLRKAEIKLIPYWLK